MRTGSAVQYDRYGGFDVVQVVPIHADHAEQLAAFLSFVNGNIAREIGRLHNWRQRFWARPTDGCDGRESRLAPGRPGKRL